MGEGLSGESFGRRIVFLALSRDSAHSTAQWTLVLFSQSRV